MRLGRDAGSKQRIIRMNGFNSTLIAREAEEAGSSVGAIGNRGKGVGTPWPTFTREDCSRFDAKHAAHFCKTVQLSQPMVVQKQQSTTTTKKKAGHARSKLGGGGGRRRRLQRQQRWLGGLEIGLKARVRSGSVVGEMLLVYMPWSAPELTKRL